MLGVLLDRSGQSERLFFRHPACYGERHHPVLPECEGTRLVEHHDVERARLLQAAPVADQQSALCSQGRGDCDDQRYRQPECVGTGDHQDRHRPLDREGGRGPDGQPDDQCERPSGERDDRQPERRAVGQRLGPALRGLGLFHQPHDPREHRFGTNARDDDTQGPRLIDGPADDLVADHLRDRAGLPREHRLVHAPLPVLEHPVGRDPCARADQEEVPGLECGDRHLFHHLRPSPGAHPFRCIREELGKFGKSPLRLGDRTHLDPVPEQHDRDEGRQLFPERHSREAERHGRTEAEGDRDGEGDQRHHPRQAVLQFSEGPLEEGPSTMSEDECSEDHGDPLRSRKHRGHIPQCPLQHVPPDQGRQGQEEGKPEPIAEHRDRVPRVAVVRMMRSMAT